MVTNQGSYHVHHEEWDRQTYGQTRPAHKGQEVTVKKDITFNDFPHKMIISMRVLYIVLRMTCITSAQIIRFQKQMGLFGW